MTQINYISTRNKQNRVTASQAILKGIAEDGGLYVPEIMPKMNFDWNELKDKNYQAIATEVLSLFLTDYTETEIEFCVNQAYDSKFTDERIVPLVNVKDDVFSLELFHGSTIAFKDMALSILPHLMTLAAKKQQIDDEIVILTATSGDTGKAAMAGFANVPGTRIVVFYPKEGVSEIQRLQMVTQKGENTKVVAIEGNFDDAQTEVKNILNDEKLREDLKNKGFRFSSANSINIGRLTPQVAYYVYGYAQLVKLDRVVAGQEIDIVVPTGNFGNILAAYYAKNIGVPIRNLICASNQNNVLVDFFNNGHYDRKRSFFVTNSPSMDILVSSNLERLVFDLTGGNDKATAKFMSELSNLGEYKITAKMYDKLHDFYAYYADEEQTLKTIKNYFNQYQYLMDPHTAVAFSVYDQYKADNANLVQVPTLIASTASPYKFPLSVMSAFNIAEKRNDFVLVEAINQLSGMPVPEAVAEIINAPILHDNTSSINGMIEQVLNFLNV